MAQAIQAGERGSMATVRTTLVVEECCRCGTVFAFADELRQKCLDDRGPNGRQFYCPNGHAQHYTGATAAQRLERELSWSRDRAARIERERDHAEARRRGQLGANTRLKKRVANGVCPCCKRTFKDLARHMTGQHPEFVEKPDAA